MNVEITNIVVVSFSGTDDVFCETKLPIGVWPFTGFATFKLQAAHGTGEQYAKDNFPGVPCRVVKG